MKQVSLRLSFDLIKRVEALAKIMRTYPLYRGVGLSKASVYRMALYRGVLELEEEEKTARSKTA
jgi:hypothetical protein